MKVTVTMNVFMYVIREFEDAIVDCKSGCTSDTCNDDPAVHAWDEGVAFYSGSLEQQDGYSSGKMLHQLADKRCQNFKTCGMNGDLGDATTSFINHKLLQLFQRGQQQLKTGQCSAAKLTLPKITKLMYVPLIQGALKYAWEAEKGDRSEKTKAEGAVFTAAVLPRIHAADTAAATVIYNNMKVGAESTSFSAVKAAFESVYAKLGISCKLVGGYIGADGVIKAGAGACDSNGEKSEDDAGKSSDDKSEDDKSEDDKSEDDKSQDDGNKNDGKSADDEKSQDDNAGTRGEVALAALMIVVGLVASM